MSELWDDFVFDLDMPMDKPEDKPSPQKIRVHTQRGKQQFDMRRYASEQALLAAAAVGTIVFILTNKAEKAKNNRAPLTNLRRQSRRFV